MRILRKQGVMLSKKFGRGTEMGPSKKFPHISLLPGEEREVTASYRTAELGTVEPPSR